MAEQFEKKSLRAYPRLVIDLAKLRSNIAHVTAKCEAAGIEVAGVVKGCNGLVPAMRQFAEAGCR